MASRTPVVCGECGIGHYTVSTQGPLECDNCDHTINFNDLEYQLDVGESYDVDDGYVVVVDENEKNLDYVDSCPACGEFTWYCMGHGALGDPVGFRILNDHYYREEHSACHPFGCEEATLLV